ncbi:MAG: CU044_2847 family protein [Pirellulales bacterium]
MTKKGEPKTNARNARTEAVITFSRLPGKGGYQGAESVAGQVASEALPALADAIGPAAQAFQQRLGELKIVPKEVQLQLGVTLEGKFNWFVVAGGEASVTVTLKW